MTRYNAAHMTIPWHDYAVSGDGVPAADAALSEKASVIGRMGMILLSCGASAWRVRNAMTAAAQALGVTAVIDIGIVALNFTCIAGHESCAQSYALGGVSVNTYKLDGAERFADDFAEKCAELSIDGIHSILDDIQSTPDLHSGAVQAVTAGMICAAIAFLLGAGVAEILCVLIGAACGQYLRQLILGRELTIFISIAAAAAASCVAYALAMLCARLLFRATGGNGAGYICAVLYLVPGFPFITSVLDLAKLDMRSGIERLTYSVIVVLVATVFVWAAGLAFGFESESLSGPELPLAALIVLRLAASFVGIYGISVMCNGTHRMALAAALTGTVPNVIRIELGDLLTVPIPIAAFVGALLVGIFAVAAIRLTGFPRMAITVPCVSVSVPGFYMYKAIYYFGTGAPEAGLNALIRVCGVIFSLALGILFAKFITEPRFRRKD